MRSAIERLREPRLAERLMARLRGLPPPALQDGIGGSRGFVKIGRAFARFLRELAGLRPEHGLLDIGSGVGRMAIPLTRFLRPPGFYEGFDIWPEGVEWCQRRTTTRFPHFRFTRVDVRNDLYNPSGSLGAADFRFPYPDRHFDVALAASVFTHLTELVTPHYLEEMARVLRPGSRALLTVFLLDATSERGITAGVSLHDFRHPLTFVTRTTTPDNPESGIAYRADWFLAAIQNSGLTVIEPIHYGSWSGVRPRLLHGHDILIVRRY